MQSNSSAAATRPSLNIFRRTQAHDRPTLRPNTKSASLSTLPEEIQLDRVTRQSQSHNEPSLQETTQPDLPDDSDPRALSLDTISRSRSPAQKDLLKSIAYFSLVLENSGSLARDHLSIERTWLAYMRTSLVIAGTGVGACFVYYFILVNFERRVFPRPT